MSGGIRRRFRDCLTRRTPRALALETKNKEGGTWVVDGNGFRSDFNAERVNFGEARASMSTSA